MAKYEALLVSPDGGFVTDFREDSIEKVKEDLADRNGKWFFYPYEFIIEAHEGPNISGTKYGHRWFFYPLGVHVDIKYKHSNFLKKKIIYASQLKFMKGWTVGRAIKKIAVENSKLKEGEPDWGFTAYW